jgi:F420-non-reducing hydrogenase iron-sulfur subunit
MQYPSNVRLIRLMCTGRLNPAFMLNAFRAGMDGVMVSG